MQENEKRALSKCMAICSRAEKCIFDIQKKLDAWEIEPEESQKIIGQLIAEKFIDEERYTNYYVRDKFRFNHWGKVKIAFMLKSKGLPKHFVQRAMEQINDKEYLDKLTEIIQQKNKSVKAASDFEKRIKLSKFAQGRGFEFDVINKALQVL